MKRSDIKKEIWKNAKQEMRIAIIESAKQRGMIAYCDLLSKMSSLRLELEQPDHRSLMAEMLGEISLAEDKAGRGMLSALVVHKTGDMEPGQGFFHYAEVLGRDISDRLTCCMEFQSDRFPLPQAAGLGERDRVRGIKEPA